MGTRPKPRPASHVRHWAIAAWRSESDRGTSASGTSKTDDKHARNDSTTVGSSSASSRSSTVPSWHSAVTRWRVAPDNDGSPCALRRALAHRQINAACHEFFDRVARCKLPVDAPVGGTKSAVRHRRGDDRGQGEAIVPPDWLAGRSRRRTVLRQRMMSRVERRSAVRRGDVGAGACPRGRASHRPFGSRQPERVDLHTPCVCRNLNIKVRRVSSHHKRGGAP